mmetsp:Transcript_26168/g.47801  ORF Transcript_26168/g.47801 Transcript_26168/m.47801 type:complete len:320 (-) Transcript_26168:88-1047(-)
MLSQSFGLTNSLPATQAAAKPARQEEVETCMPATVRMAQEAAMGPVSEAKNVFVHGKEVGVMLLVGMVEEIAKQGSSMEFSINDGSGRMKVKYYVTTELPADLASLQVGDYIKAVGSVRAAPSPHLSAVVLKKVASYDEVSYHLIEVAYAALKMQRSGQFKVPTPTPFKLVLDPQTPAPKKSTAVPVAPKNDKVESPEKPLMAASEPPSQMEGVALFNMDPQDTTGDMRTQAAATEAAPVPMEVDSKAQQDLPPEEALKKEITKRLAAAPVVEDGLEVAALLKGLPGTEAEARKVLEGLVEECEVLDCLSDGTRYALLS